MNRQSHPVSGKSSSIFEFRLPSNYYGLCLSLTSAAEVLRGSDIMGSDHPRPANARLIERKRALGARCFRPRFEALESRALLAILGLDIQLLLDVGGQPGAAFSDAADLVHGADKPLEVGDFFWVQVLAWDQRAADSLPSEANPSPGVISLPLNMAWDPAVVDYVGDTPDGDPGPNPGQPNIAVPVGSALLTPNFIQQRFLSDFDDQTNNPTQLDGFATPTNANLLGLRGGALGVGAPIGTIGPSGTDQAPAWFSRLRFRATAAANESPFVMQLAGSMSFADAAGLDAINHLVPDGTGFENADDLNRITEFIQIVEMPEAGPSSLSGFVYVDTNPMNGVLDADNVGVAVEFGIPNVTISLFLNNLHVDTTTTGADGGYLFDDLDPGRYRIVETQPPRFITSASSVGTILPGNVQSGTAGIDEILDIQLGENQDGIDYNFGEIPIPDKRMFLARTDMREILASQRSVAARTVSGTSGDDTIVVEALDDALRVTLNNQVAQRIPLASARILYLDTGGGQDRVELRGTSGGELASLSPGAGTLRLGKDYLDSNFALMAVAAEQVIADGAGGNDLAVMRDSPGDDALVAAGAAATLTSVDSRLAQALAFERIRAFSTVHAGASDQDTADVDATDYVLATVGKWQTI
ncbi:MAG: SdrD B-like domain-containing protein [Pirellulales bacterium]